MTVKERIEQLRELMRKNGIDAYVVPTSDFHQSEYVGEHFKARKFITGFTGSAGTAVITLDEARLWTDGRYFTQAAKQLEGSGVELMRMAEPGVPTINEYLKSTLVEGNCLGFDGRVVAMGEGQGYEEITKSNKATIKYEVDLIDEIWEDRPELSKKPAFKLGEEYAGESAASKIERIREYMKECGATYHTVATIDDICWVLNMRGDDIDFFPLVLSYMVVKMDGVDLYIDETKLNDELKAEFAEIGVAVHPYNDVYADTKKIPAGETILIDPARLNYAIYSNIPEGVAKVEERNPEVLFKAMKNPKEIENMRIAQIKDSVAHVKFMKWVKENVETMEITEMSASEKLDELREEMGNFIRPSFEPISAYADHAAMMHYCSKPETDVRLREGSVYLTDTGAGFWEGTTDITRTFVLGEVSDTIKEHFTLVAMCNLRLANATFLQGCVGMNLDILARKALWERGLDYKCGTGHGVGYLLNIHEAPTSLRWRYRAGDTHKFEEGMILTDEPGVYIEGSHGIRLENELLVCMGEQNEYGQFMYFEPITYIPFDLDGIVPEVMNSDDIKYLNEYHKLVFEKVSPYLDEEETEWLRKYTREI
ncbi:aminopeptidase P family N-terminal domain-containing protein [Peptacetobacter hiranonis]|uniref:Creatinase n=1 Tax=Peptacetobacter hiranonis (strain DSM 13275 / JCM 10541 / KCTC 15199 / TO-931) TaxID=500633 RepID=B6FYM4_PEPHT|nr:aminopeptidase P family N-terminal domain-containing protein [Peptacetobacter hiranonis]EEA85380.1 Creatinase [Peptacetobacter hiranonis DSM 13275]QEK20272.1 Aminopeptidase YpdF [Peptacetobacter hiranonis]